MRGNGNPSGGHEDADFDLRPLASAMERAAVASARPPESEGPGDASNEDFLFHLYRGSELLQDNRVHEAKEELERALHLQPRDVKGQDLLAVVYFRLGLYPRAISIYEQLRRKNPRDTALLLNLALCYLKTGQAALARRDLEALLALNPNHTRAWGYLGLACDRLGDLPEAQRAFDHGGHAQMARRVAERRASVVAPAAPPVDAFPSREVREVVATAFEELDAGELSFALAEPASDNHAARGSWRSVELGQRPNGEASPASPRVQTKKPDTKDGTAAVQQVPQLGAPPTEERRPTLIVGVPPAAAEAADLAALSLVPSPRSPAFSIDDNGSPSLRRPPTSAVRVPGVRVPAPSQKPEPLLEEPAKRTLPPPAPAPPMLRGPTPPPPANFDDIAEMQRSSRPESRPESARGHGPRSQPSSSRSYGAPSSNFNRNGSERYESPPPPAAPTPPPTPVHPSPVPRMARSFADAPNAPDSSSSDIAAQAQAGTRNGSRNPYLSQPAQHAPRARSSIDAQLREPAEEPTQDLVHRPVVAFPAPGRTVLHASGVALVRTTLASGFAARLEAIRASSSALTMKLLERQSKGKSTGESFGGVGSPVVHATGDGQLVLGPRAGRKLSNFALVDDEMCFVREDVLLGWDFELSYENGRLATGENESVAVVQLRGKGTVLLEAIGEVLPLDVQASRGLSVRREVVLGWFGRLVPRALPPTEAPCGQRGLVSFAGEGRVLIAGG